MLSHTIRVSRPALRLLPATTPVARRSIFTPSQARRADLVQDLYLKELKAYKTPPVKPSDADAHVLKWSTPATPKSPEESDIASDLQAYESQTVEVEGQAAGEATAAVEEDDLDFEEDEAPGGH